MNELTKGNEMETKITIEGIEYTIEEAWDYLGELAVKTPGSRLDSEYEEINDCWVVPENPLESWKAMYNAAITDNNTYAAKEINTFYNALNNINETPELPGYWVRGVN